MKETQQYTMGELFTLEYGKPVPDKESIDGSVPVYGTNGQIGTSHLKPLCNHPSVILGRKGAYRGVHYSNRPFSVIDTAFYIELITDKVDIKWLYYKLLTYDINSMDSGSAIPSTDRYQIYSLPIEVPSISTQRRIVDVLDSITTKIELNRQINDNLEQQLQALYNEWFVENPKSDWHSVNLSEIATFVSGYSYKGNELVENSDTAMATIKNFERNGGFKIDGYKPIIPSPKLKVDQRAQLFDILVAHTDLTQNAEVIGNAEILLSKDIYKDLIFSMDLVKVNAKESFPFQFLLALLLKNPRFKSHCIGYVNGTTVLHMNKRALPDYETIIPNLEDAQNLNATAKAIFCQMSENLTEISNLTEMRDTLLPRLMSGELKINDLDS